MTGLRLTMRDDEAGRLPRWRLILVAVVVAILAGGLYPASPAGAAFLGRNGLIAFAGPGGGIYTVKPDGSSLRRVGPGTDPAWSPDGKKIAFVSGSSGNADIFVMNANGSNVVRVTKHASYDKDPAWSPDGRRLVFASDRNNGFHIFVIRSTAPFGVPTQITFQNPDYDFRHFDTEPAWSPDGNFIMYSGHDIYGEDGGILGLHRVYVGGSGGSEPTYIPGPKLDNLSASYAPRGRKISYINSRDYFNLYPFNVYKANPDGSDPVNLTNNVEDFDGPYYEHPVWSADGNSLVVTRWDQNGATRTGLYVMRADGTGMRWLTDGYRADWQPIPL